MISQGFLDGEISESREQRRTSLFIRKLTLHVVDAALRQHYGADYPIRCLQASCGIRRVLGSFGIAARLVVGAACFSEVNRKPPVEVSWGGFWDQDHHIWTLTEYDEIVDLTITQLHLHPAKQRCDAVPIPAVWWSPSHRWPSIILYLPEGEIMEGPMLARHRCLT